jgi:hypothetical protein
MSMSMYALNLGVLALVLITGLGTHTFTARRLLLPLVAVAITGTIFLRDIPTLGNDVNLELAGAAAGVVFGILAALLVRVRRDGDRVITTAGIAYALVWIVVIGGRMLFAYGADHWFTGGIVSFSRTYLITGADAWTVAFVLMALAMVLTRVLVTAVQAGVLRARPAVAAAHG